MAVIWRVPTILRHVAGVCTGLIVLVRRQFRQRTWTEVIVRHSSVTINAHVSLASPSTSQVNTPLRVIAQTLICPLACITGTVFSDFAAHPKDFYFSPCLALSVCVCPCFFLTVANSFVAPADPCGPCRS